MKKKIIRIILIILSIILIMFLIHAVRNYIIISNLQNKIAQYKDSIYHHIRIVSNQQDNSMTIINYYHSGNHKVLFLERELNGKISKISAFSDGEKYHTYIESEDKKIATNDAALIELQIYNGTETESFGQKLLSSFFASIKSVKENGKKYYQIKNIYSTYFMTTEGQVSLIDPETGLLYKTVENGSTTRREYEFDQIDERVFIEPDISQYQIKE